MLHEKGPVLTQTIQLLVSCVTLSPINDIRPQPHESVPGWQLQQSRWEWNRKMAPTHTFHSYINERLCTYCIRSWFTQRYMALYDWASNGNGIVVCNHNRQWYGVHTGAWLGIMCKLLLHLYFCVAALRTWHRTVCLFCILRKQTLLNIILTSFSTH